MPHAPGSGSRYQLDCYKRIPLPVINTPLITLTFPCPVSSNQLLVTFSVGVIISSPPAWSITWSGPTAHVLSWSTVNLQTYLITVSQVLTGNVTIVVPVGDQSVKSSAGLIVIPQSYACGQSPPPPPPPPPPTGCCSGVTLPGSLTASLVFSGLGSSLNGSYVLKPVVGGWLYSNPLPGPAPYVGLVQVVCVGDVWQGTVSGAYPGSIPFSGIGDLSGTCVPFSQSGTIVINPSGSCSMIAAG